MERLTYSIQETADMLGISRGTIYNMRDRGEIRLVKLGRRSLVPTTEIQRLITPPTPSQEPELSPVAVPVEVSPTRTDLPDTPEQWLAELLDSRT